MKLALLIILLLGLFWNTALAQEQGFVYVDKQVQIVTDLSNSQDRFQSFAYIVQVKDSDGVTVSLAWITGSLSPNQHLSPALSWTPEKAGVYVAEIFVWNSITNPEPLSPPLYLEIEVRENIEHEG
ncbi:MAG TPA: hypothetical protein VLC72_05640 [Nitrosopumilaceae archaeon]|nr:hypothetical protein [Nitrosopumilaceae archaeon]